MPKGGMILDDRVVVVVVIEISGKKKKTDKNKRVDSRLQWPL